MKRETKDFILSHIPLFLFIFVPILIVIDGFNSRIRVISGLLFFSLFILQGLVYIFNRKVFLKSSYLVLWEKIVIGLMYIGVGLYWIIKYFNTIQLMVITLLQGS